MHPFDNLEIHKVFPRFSKVACLKNLSLPVCQSILSATADIFYGTTGKIEKNTKKHLQYWFPCGMISGRLKNCWGNCALLAYEKEVNDMKEGIHPKYEQTTIRCACGNTFTTGSTKKEIRVEICSKCHPFYTGKQKLVDTGGRVDRFNKRFGLK